MSQVAPEVEAVREAVAGVVRHGASLEALAASGLLEVGEDLGLAEIATVARELGRAGVADLGYLDSAVAALALGDTLPTEVAAGTARIVVAPRPVYGGPPAGLANGTVTGRWHGTEGAAWVLAPVLDGDTEVLALFADPTTARVVGDAGRASYVRDAITAGLVAQAAGLVEGALRITSGYVAEREQFGRRLAEFQAVAQQVADVYVAARTLGVVADNAVWRVAEGLPAGDDLAVAAYWVAAQAPHALQVCHHLHGGMGLDETYPLPAYTTAVAALAARLGGSQRTLERVRIEDPASAWLELSAEQRALRAELRSYFSDLVPAETAHALLTERHGPLYKEVVRTLGKDGWLGVGWPAEYGGKGFGELEQTIFANEAVRAEVPLPSVTLQTVGPTLQRFGTPEQKERFLPGILSGEVHFAIGYTEPDAGTDLASLRCTAVRDGDHYVVNGQKTFTTGGHAADYVWLAVRTDPDAPRHRGISILIVDTSDPGYSWTPIITADGAHHVNATYYSDVRVPVDMLVGEEHQGWRLITTQLNHERVMLAPAGRLEGLRDRVATWAARRGVADRPDVARAIGEATAAFRVNELLNWSVARAAQAGEMSVADASASKVFASDETQRLGRLLAEVVQQYGDPADPETAALLHLLDRLYLRHLVLTFGGGVNEVQRELIAQFGLGLPRVPR